MNTFFKKEQFWLRQNGTIAQLSVVMGKEAFCPVRDTQGFEYALNGRCLDHIDTHDLVKLLYDPSEPKVGPVVEWPEDSAARWRPRLNEKALLRLYWENGIVTDRRLAELNDQGEEGGNFVLHYQVLWSPDAKDYEMPKPKVEVRWCGIASYGFMTFRNTIEDWMVSEDVKTNMANGKGWDFFIRSEFLNGQLIGKPVVLTREEALREVEGE